MFQDFTISDCVMQSPERDRVVVDVGACDGRYLNQQARFHHVYAIEPEVSSFYFLRQTAGAFDNVTCLNRAVGSGDEHRFWKHHNPMVHTINPVIAEQRSGWVDVETVRTITLDQLWSEIKGRGETVGLMMFDAEGAEDFAFKYARALLDENRSWLQIVLETHEGVDLQMLHRLLSESGYRCYMDGVEVNELEHDKHYLVRARD